MTAEQFEQVLGGMGPHPLEMIAWLAIIATAIVAIYALIYTHAQISTARKNAKLLFLAELDRRWEGAEMKEARSKWRELRNYVNNDVKELHPELDAQQNLEKRAELCSTLLYTMLTNNVEDYTKIMGILGFYETVGYLGCGLN